MTVKVGDKVRVTSDKYPNSCPRGAVCTVKKNYTEGDIDVTSDRTDGFGWLLIKGEYEPITEEVPEYDYAEQAAKHGIKITVEFSGGDVVTFDGKK